MELSITQFSIMPLFLQFLRHFRHFFLNFNGIFATFSSILIVFSPLFLNLHISVQELFSWNQEVEIAIGDDGGCEMAFVDQDSSDSGTLLEFYGGNFPFHVLDY